MRASFTKVRATRIASTLSHSSPAASLTTRTISSTSRRCNHTTEDGRPLRFSDFQKSEPAEKPDGKPNGKANTSNDPSSHEKPRYTQDASGDFMTYTPKGATTGYQIERQDHLLTVTDLANGESQNLYAHTLRDACICSGCRDKSSGNKKFSQSQIPLDIGFKKARPEPKGLWLSFTNDLSPGHQMMLSWDRLEAVMKNEPAIMGTTIRDRLVAKTGIVSWDRETISKRVRTIDYGAFVKGKKAMWDVVTDLSRYGLVFLKNVPEQEDSIEKITTTIANIKETFYGRTFDVRAKPRAENVAYTSGYLGLHQDLLYLESPPQIQLLHCLENSCSGGESLFADGDRVGRALLAASAGPDAARLRQGLHMPVPYQYNKNGYYYMKERPFLQVKGGSDDPARTFETMWWSPPFAAPHFNYAYNREPLLMAAKAFDKAIHAEENMYERKMKPGECVLFDNRRVMHGRRAFDAQGGGSRWLRGAYISEEDFFSKASYLPEGHAVATRGNAVRSRAEADREVASSPLAKEMWKVFVQAPKESKPMQIEKEMQERKERDNLKAQEVLDDAVGEKKMEEGGM